MTAVIRACVAGAMAGVVLVTTCVVAGPSVAAAQAAQQEVPPPASNAPPPPAAPVPADVQPVQPPPPAPETTGAPPAEVAPPVPTEATPPAPGSTFVVAPPPVDTNLQPAPEPTMDAAEPTSKVPSYVLWGTGAASLIVGTVFGGLALSAKKDFDDNPSYDRADTVDHRALVADVAFGLGIVLAVTGTVFYLAHDDQPAQQAQNQRDHKLQLSVAPIVSPRAGGGALQLRF